MFKKLIIPIFLISLVFVSSGCTTPPKDCETSVNCIRDAVINCVPATFETDLGLFSSHINVIGRKGDQCEIEAGMGLASNKCLLNATNGKFNYEDVAWCMTKHIEETINESWTEGLFEEDFETSETVSQCPDISKTTTFKFEWGKSISGHENLYLLADFITNLEFSDSWVLDNQPMIGKYHIDAFYCERGSKTGESINKLYCRLTIDYHPRLRKNIIDDQGSIVKTDYLYIKSFIFDIAGKDIQNAEDLKDLKLESMLCSESDW